MAIHATDLRIQPCIWLVGLQQVVQALIVDLNIAHDDPAVLPIFLTCDLRGLGKQALQSTRYEPSSAVISAYKDTKVEYASPSQPQQQQLSRSHCDIMRRAQGNGVSGNVPVLGLLSTRFDQTASTTSTTSSSKAAASHLFKLETTEHFTCSLCKRV